MNDVAALRNAGLLASKAFSPKALHIRIYPTPIDIAERRGILNVLRGYGEIDTFRNMKWEHRNSAPNTCLAIFRDGVAAQRLVTDSPLRFTLKQVEHEQSQEPRNPYLDLFNKLEAQSSSQEGGGSTYGIASPWLSDSETAADGTTSDPIDSQSSITQSGQSLQEGHNARSSKSQRTFLVHASPWTSNLTAIIDRAPYTGSYAIDTKSLSYLDLYRRVPLPGLSVVDFSAKPLPVRIVEKRRAALASRKTLRQIMQEKDKQQEGSAVDGADDTDAPDVAAMSTYVTDGRGGYIGRQEAERRATGNPTGSGDHSGDSLIEPGVNPALLNDVPQHELPAIRDSMDGYERARRRNPSPWSRKYDRMM